MGDDKVKAKGTTVTGEAPDNTAKVFGEMMRSARQVTGMSLAQLSETTRITQEFVEALEHGEFSKLPGAVFGRGFVRAICKALSLDSQDYVAAFDEALKSGGAETRTGNLKVASTEGVSSVRLRSESTRDRGMLSAAAPSLKSLSKLPIGAILGVTLVAVAIPATLWMIGRPTGKTKPSTTTSTAVREDLQDSNEEFTQDIEQQAANLPDEAGSQSTGNTDATTATKSETASAGSQEPTSLKVQAEQGDSAKQLLDVTVREAMKLKINLDNGAWDTKNMEPGNYRFEFSHNAELLVFDASAVDIKFNGRSLGNLGNKGRVRRLSFAAKKPESNLNRDQKL